ncbi:hypothetical protein U9M48_026031 [Paspalum notatum var. saurae]|uniref:Uncharacterized protein n=1 Tax=Paspalum notatum var. saurae TaxID=547442 RepID=A0AAQ3TUH5_PASNO
MGDGDAASGNGGRRCPKHPSEPPFTGFCSACLLDRLHATNLIGVAAASPSQAHHHQDDGLALALQDLPPPPAASTSTAPGPGRRTTLLHLFQLEDQGGEQLERQPEPDTQDAAASTSASAAQDPPPHLLQRKRSLRHSCSEWIACCDTSTAANHSSCLPSRQSLDASSSTATSAANDAMAAASASAASATSNNGVAMVERRTGSLRWNQLWSIKGLLSRPAGHLLDRSFSESESSRSRHAPRSGSGAIARSSSSRSQGIIRLNGSHSVSSAGNGMDSSEISLPGGDSVGHAPHAHHSRPRLKDRLHWLRRSRSVHYSTPTTIVDAGLTPFRSRSSSTRSMAHKNHSRFAAGFFAAQRHRHS